jgi:chromosome segregation protein
MYLKTLSLHGFKSFADKTLLEFHPGVTGIVGPNGCGKSNVVDAVRWVLGETSAKALRGSEMADVIFSGTDKRKPMGMAEVTLTFADCEEALKVEFNEVAVTRRVFRDGHSEYLLNGKACRLKDIHDLFMDTGIGRTSYSIMAQGQIDMLLSSKPEDRRVVFEEAAGITKFKKQKKETLRKLEYTEANLLRLTDILAEVRRQMNSLQRQAAKARRYQILLNDTRVLDTHLSFKHYTELSAQKHELDTSIASLKRQLAVLEEQLAGRESALDASRLELANIDNRLGETRHAVNERQNRIQSARARIAYNEERARELEDLIQSNESDIKLSEDRLNQQQMDLLAADEALTLLKSRIEGQKEEALQAESSAGEIRIRRAEMARSIADLRNKVNAAEAKLAGLQARIENTRVQRRADETRAQALAGDIARVEETSATQKSELENVVARVVGLEDRIVETETARDDADRQHRQSQAELALVREGLALSRRQRAEREARLDVVQGLIASGEGLDDGTQAILGGLDDPSFFKNGVRGVLAQHLDVPSELVPAIEAALGQRLQAVLVADATMAHRMMEILREKKLGTAAVVAADLIPNKGPGQMMVVPEGAIAWAMDRITTRGTARNLFESLLRDVLVVPDLTTAMRLRAQFPDVTFATLDGETLNPQGILTGGRRSEAVVSMLERRNEVKGLEAEIAGLVAGIMEDETRESSLLAKAEEAARQVEYFRSQGQHLLLEKSTLDGQASMLRREIEQLESRLEQIRWERDELDQRLRKANDDTTAMEAEVESTRAECEGARTAVQNGEASLEELSVEESRAVERLNEIRTALAVEERSRQAMEEQLKPMAQRLSELGDLIERRRRETDAHRSRIAGSGEENGNLIASISQAERQLETFQRDLEELSADRARHAESLRAEEAAIQQARKEVHRLGEQSGREEIQATQLELRIGNNVNTCRERHGIELSAFEQDIHALRLAIESQRKARRRRASGDDASADAEAVVEAPVEEEPETAAAAAALADGEGEGPDWAFVETVIAELRQRLESMGPVNLDAIQEFEELEERHNFLQSQHDDLVKSKHELLDIIEHINKETRVRFLETFAQVRENFGQMFKTLFGERAQANLLLMDENDPLESGIEIIAKPPGKKLQSISLLSGGERSLTAVALLFSIYMVKPSPFCVLDELDAPLDETNIGRFVRVLDNFIDKSQFIIVTHSKRTMARADIMYGVTMEEFGVSKPVGMRMTSEEKDRARRVDPVDDDGGGGDDSEPAIERELNAAEKVAQRLDPENN